MQYIDTPWYKVYITVTHGMWLLLLLFIIIITFFIGLESNCVTHEQLKLRKTETKIKRITIMWYIDIV